MGRLSYGQPVGTWHYPGAAGVLKRKNRKKRRKKRPMGLWVFYHWRTFPILRMVS